MSFTEWVQRRLIRRFLRGLDDASLASLDDWARGELHNAIQRNPYRMALFVLCRAIQEHRA